MSCQQIEKKLSDERQQSGSKLSRRAIIDLFNINAAVLCLSLAAYYFATEKALDATLLMTVGLFNAFVVVWNPQGAKE